MVYIHNAHLVFILHNCKYFNSMLFCSACCFWLNCRSDKRHRMSLWMHKRYHHKLFCGAFIGTGTYSAVYWSNFTFVFLKSRCTIYFSLSLGPPTHAHKTARTLILKSEIALWIFSLSSSKLRLLKSLHGHRLGQVSGKVNLERKYRLVRDKAKNKWNTKSKTFTGPAKKTAHGAKKNELVYNWCINTYDIHNS